MAKKKTNVQPDTMESVENVLSRTEQYIEDNQKSLTIIIAAIVVIVGGYLAFNRFYIDPMEKEAQAQMFVAEQYFEKDSFNLALNGDGVELGLLDIIDEYGMTKSANLAHYYAGISYLHLGDFEGAIEYLKGFESDDQIIYPIALGAMGDAYSELEDYETALSYYMKAANKNVNEFTSPIYLMKAAQVHEHLSNYGDAIAIYERIRKDHPKSNEARHIDKYITRANGFLNK